MAVGWRLVAAPSCAAKPIFSNRASWYLFPALSEAMWRDGGTIYVFDQRNQAGGKVLRGHQGEVRKLAFAPQRAGKPPLLVSAAIERGTGKPFGSVRLWDVENGGEALAMLEKLPAPAGGAGAGCMAHRRRQDRRACGDRLARNRSGH